MKNADLQEILKKFPADADVEVSMHLSDVYTLLATEAGFNPDKKTVVIRQAKKS